MESHSQPSFFFPSPNLSSSLSQDHLIINDNFDLYIPIYDNAFDELMFPDSGFISNTGFNLRELEVFDAQLQPTTNTGFHILDIPASTHDENYLTSVGDGDDAVCGFVEDDLHDDCGNGESSGMAMAKPRRDRSKTLVSERKRRGRMKDTLYLLRSLVPNITKMDKASIIADSIDYVKNMQGQAKKLAEEIKELECPPTQEQMLNVFSQEAVNVSHVRKNNLGFRVSQVSANEVGEGRFYVMVECDNRSASSLYVAIESLQCFHLESSNFVMVAERSVLTLTLRVIVFEEEMSAAAVKLSVIRALRKEGFMFQTLTN